MQTDDTRVNNVRETSALATYGTWLAAQVQEAIDDPRPNIAHEDVMAEMDADIAALTRVERKSARRHA